MNHLDLFSERLKTGKLPTWLVFMPLFPLLSPCSTLRTLLQVGISMAVPVAPTAALSAVMPGDIGKASGVNSTLQRFGSVFAVAVASAVFGAFGKLGAADTFLSGFRPALGVVGALALLASITALAVTTRDPLGKRRSYL